MGEWQSVTNGQCALRVTMGGVPMGSCNKSLAKRGLWPRQCQRHRQQWAVCVVRKALAGQAQASCACWHIGWSAYCEIRDRKKAAEKLDKVLAKIRGADNGKALRAGANAGEPHLVVGFLECVQLKKNKGCRLVGVSIAKFGIRKGGGKVG